MSIPASLIRDKSSVNISEYQLLSLDNKVILMWAYLQSSRLVFFHFFLELLFVLQKRIIFIKSLKNPNAKLSYIIEGTIAAVYFRYDLVKILWSGKWKSFKSANNDKNNGKNKVYFDHHCAHFERVNWIFSLT